MRDDRRPFLETLFDWDAQPTNRRTRTLFQPKGLGTVLPGSGARRHAVSRHVFTLMIASVATGAGVIAALAFARYFHIGWF